MTGMHKWGLGCGQNNHKANRDAENCLLETAIDWRTGVTVPSKNQGNDKSKKMAIMLYKYFEPQ